MKTLLELFHVLHVSHPLSPILFGNLFLYYVNNLKNGLLIFFQVIWIFFSFFRFLFFFFLDILIPIDNIITADSEGFVKRNYFSLLFSMFASVMNAGSSEIVEGIQVSACQLIELALQNSHNSADSYINDILHVCMNRMNQHFYGIALPTVMFNVVR